MLPQDPILSVSLGLSIGEAGCHVAPVLPALRNNPIVGIGAVEALQTLASFPW